MEKSILKNDHARLTIIKKMKPMSFKSFVDILK